VSKATCVYTNLYMVYIHLYKIIEGTRCQARCCGGSHIHATALALRRRWIPQLLKTVRSDRGWKLNEPLVALPLRVPMAPLAPLALLLPIPLAPLLVQLPSLLLQLSLLLPPMALLVDHCWSRSWKTKKEMACPGVVLRSANPCAVRTLQRRAGRAGVARPCRKACGFS
jgi:hypothetical protein